jgi:putative endonuclease
MANFIVYILFSESHHRYYIGQTADIDDRLKRHNCGYELSTKPYAPWQLVCTIQKASRSEAVILERKLKNLNSEDLRKFISKYGYGGHEA